MRYNGINLEEVLHEHRKYLKSLLDKNPLEELKADFSNMTLTNIDFKHKKLKHANFEGSKISLCNFIQTDLEHANFENCDIEDTYFFRTFLEFSTFANSKMNHVFFNDSTCFCVDFSGTEIDDVKILKTELREAKNPPFVPLVCPEEGSFIGWKKCLSENGHVIVKLLIPAEAKRSSATGRKCRASEAVVLDIQTMDGEHYPDVAYSIYNATHIYGTAFNYSNPDRKFEYRIGEQVETEEPFEEDRFEECASGIHFFITRQEAVDY